MKLNGLVERMLAMRFALPVVLLSAATFLVFTELSYDRATVAVRTAVQLGDARAAMQRVLQLMVDAETGQRGYLLAGQDDFLEPYRAAVADMPMALQALETRWGALGTSEAMAVQQVARLVAARLKEMDTTIRWRQEGASASAKTAVGTGVGRQQMDEIRSLMETQLVKADNAAGQARGLIFATLLHNRLGLGTLVVLSALGLTLFIQQSKQLDVHREEQRLALLEERQRLEEQVVTRTRELRELARHLMAVREDERAHLARELHDELGSLLTAAKLDVARLRSQFKGQGAVDERLNHLTQALNDGIALKRRIIEDLRPSSLDNLGLHAALEILCREMGERLGVRVQTEFDDDVKLRAPADLAVFRFVQEALTNVSKYARAGRVCVSLAGNGDSVTVRVADDGVGFDPGASLIGHHGLSGMHFRVESLGGHMKVESTPGQGTVLQAQLPLTDASVT